MAADTIESLLQSWDGESVILHPDRPRGATIIIAIHSTRLGPAGGGTRMKNYPDLPSALRDAMRLSAVMTYKFAAVNMPQGGGKCVIAVPPNLESGVRAELLRRYGSLIHSFGGIFSTGPDVGTTDKDMDVIAESGSPYVFGRTPARGGSGNSGPPTAIGVLAGLKVVCEELFGGAVAQKRILVQGVGSVGAELIRLLRAQSAQVAFSDVDARAVAHWRDVEHVEFISPDKIYETPCDIFSPCALGGVLNEKTIPQLACRAVVGSANNQLGEERDAERLHARGIFYAPDFIVNVGGAMGLIGMESLGWSRAEADKRIAAAVTNSLRDLMRLAKKENINSELAARRIAEEKLAQANAKS